MIKLFILLFCFCALNLKAQNGIDISHHNKLNDEDWKELINKKNIKFVYIKASEGKNFKDPNFKINYDKARQHKLLIGAYHFYNDGISPKDQFNNFISITKKYKLDLIPVIDFEKNGFKNKYKKYDRLENLRQLISLFYDYYNVYPIIYSDYILYNFTYSEIKSLVDYYWINCYNSFFCNFIKSDIKQYRININEKEIDFNITKNLNDFKIKSKVE